MSDIVKRLRDLDTATCEDAADEIERLRAQVRKSALDCLAADGQAADLMGEVSKLRAAVQWRPIEEAPKDGTPLLLLWPDAAEKMAVMWWDDYCGGWMGYYDGINPGRLPPTHWMPLPPPPKGENG